MVRQLLIFATVCALAGVTSAFELPKDAAKALGATKGKPIRTGLVFINGKYVPPPYVVERWGNGIRINKTPVTGQIISWNEFIKTQEGVKITRTEIAPPPMPEPEPEEEPSVEENEDETALNELFGDDPSKKAKKKPAARKPVIRKPTVVTTYSFDGEFVPNDTTKGYVKRINEARTDIDLKLRKGSFIFFGDAYASVSGDAKTLTKLVERLPAIEHDSTTAAELRAAVRAAGFFYITDVIANDLFKNRVDYNELEKYARRLKLDEDLKKMEGSN